MSTHAVTILLFSPRLRDEHDLQVALESKGWTVVRAASARGFAAMMKARPVDLVVLDDPPWEMARFAMTAMDASPDPVPRIWLSSLPEAPANSGKLGVDALLLEPRDVDGVVAQVRRTLATARPPTEQLPIVPRAGNRRAPTVPELHPSSGRLDRFDEDTSDSWP